MGSRTDHLTGVGRLVPQGARMAAEVAEVYGSEDGTSQPGYVSQEVLASTLAAFAETIQSQVPGLNLSSFMPQFRRVRSTLRHPTASRLRRPASTLRRRSLQNFSASRRPFHVEEGENERRDDKAHVATSVLLDILCIVDYYLHISR